jgi:putative nucleotidyltransferase with HDIG domain
VILLAAVFAGRMKYNPGIALLLSLVFGGGWALLSSADLMVAGALPSARPLTYTVRPPTISTDIDPVTGNVYLQVQRKLFGRGQKLTPGKLKEVRLHRAFREPQTFGSLAAAGLFYALLVFLFSSFLRATGDIAVYLRTHLVVLISITGVMLLAKALLMFTTWSGMWIPLVALTALFGHSVGRKAACGVAVLGAVVLASLGPFDLPLMLVMLVQGLTAGAIVRGSRPNLYIALGAAFAAVAGAGACLGVQLLLFGRDVTPGALLRGVELGGLLRSDLAGAAGSAVAGGLLARVALPVVGKLLGRVSRARLTALADFSNPLLQRIAADAPGTWAHSTNLANMAEMAAKQIGADGLLLRVGAYYHDVGKCLHGDYFVENQRGENPHDNLEPDRSASVIRDHVTDGVKLARRAGLPEAITEFIYTHHGLERLEYFWHRAQSLAPAHVVNERDFRYRGVPPLTREQGILSVCDAVEAASRTLKSADQIEELVRQIVLAKLRNGVLDNSGLSIQDLRLLTESAIEFLRGSLHARVEYPWQKKQAREATDETTERQPPLQVAVPLEKKRSPNP